jgi:hypothetical protein
MGCRRDWKNRRLRATGNLILSAAKDPYSANGEILRCAQDEDAFSHSRMAVHYRLCVVGAAEPAEDVTSGG